MRPTVAAAFFWTLLACHAGVSLAQQADDDGDADDADTVGKAVEIAQQVGGDMMKDFTGPAAPAVISQVPATPAGPSVQSNAEEGNEEDTEAPKPVKLVSNLKRFGQEHKNTETASMSAEEAQAAADAKNAHAAAKSAKNAAEVANKVAAHSIHIVHHSQSALKDARDALHKARVDSSGLSSKQKQHLKTAEAKLREATKKAEYGEVKNAKYVKADAKQKKLVKLEKKMDDVKKAEKQAKVDKKKKDKEELEAMRQEIQELRGELKKKEGDKAEDDQTLKDMQDQIKTMEEQDKEEDKATADNHAAMRAEIDALKKQIEDDKAEDDAPKPKVAKVEVEIPAKVEEDEEKYDVKMKPLTEEKAEVAEEATPVEQRGIDIDTAMPYGDLEPFGREDTAQELTEASIKESDGMVDQLERAEVAEEKRAVFRALTRLRGAAITSFDGVARSQTGNIDEYNKVHKWRSSHPLHHLADEESDVSKWAFPENAD